MREQFMNYKSDFDSLGACYRRRPRLCCKRHATADRLIDDSIEDLSSIKYLYLCRTFPLPRRSIADRTSLWRKRFNRNWTV